VERHQKTEEQLKTEIFTRYSQCQDEPSSDRRQVYFSQFCGLILTWCTQYIFKQEDTNEGGTDFPVKEAHKMGVEIYDAILRLLKENTAKKLLKEEDFFKYLRTSLNSAQAEYYRNNELGSLHIPKEKKAMLKKIDDVIRMKESIKERELTEDEKLYELSDWFHITKDEAGDYLKLSATRYTVGLEFKSNTNDTDDEMELLNLKKVNSPDLPGAPANTVEAEYFAKFDIEGTAGTIRDAAESILRKAQKRTMPVYRALFTAYCINNVKNYEALRPVLDSEILEAYKNKKPVLYEIYLKYHPEVKKESAEARASQMCKEFLDNLYAKMQV
jgi:hypothetical protein